MRTIGVFAAFALLLYGLHLLGFGPPLPYFGGSGGSASPSASASPSSPAARPALSASDPFAGSPAEQFADDDAGIVPPPAHALAGYSAAQVSSAYSMTKRLLVAANLDPQTLLGGAPLAFASLLVPQQRSYFLRNLDRTGTGPNGRTTSTRAWVTSFAPGSTAFVGSVIKVHGYMTATTATYSGRPVLQVHADYLFVYPVQHPGQPATRMRIVVQAVVNAEFARWTSPNGPLLPWWSLSGNGGTSGVNCDFNDGFVHPDFPGGPTPKVKPSGAPISPYKLNPPPQRPCSATTGT